MSKPYPYRFKTETEFIKEFGQYWRYNNIGKGWYYFMDDFFGKPYPFILSKINFEKNRLNRIWSEGINYIVDNNMLTLNSPTYKPRKR